MLLARSRQPRFASARRPRSGPPGRQEPASRAAVPQADGQRSGPLVEAAPALAGCGAPPRRAPAGVGPGARCAGRRSADASCRRAWHGARRPGRCAGEGWSAGDRTLAVGTAAVAPSRGCRRGDARAAGRRSARPRARARGGGPPGGAGHAGGRRGGRRRRGRAPGRARRGRRRRREQERAGRGRRGGCRRRGRRSEVRALGRAPPAGADRAHPRRPPPPVARGGPRSPTGVDTDVSYQPSAVRTRPCRPDEPAHPAKRTVPAAAATTGAPIGAAMSMPRCWPAA